MAREKGDLFMTGRTYELFFHHMSEPVLILDDKFAVADLNPAAEAFLAGECGFPANGLHGRDGRELLPWLAPELSRAMETGRLLGRLERRTEIMGRPRCFVAEIIPFHEKGESRLGVLAADVTAFVNMERAFAEEHLQLQLILDSITATAIVATDSLGMVTMCNTGTERMLGIEAAQAVGRPVWEVLPDDEALAEAGWRNMQSCGREKILGMARQARDMGLAEGECALSVGDGASLPVAMTVASVRSLTGESIGSLYVIQDLSEEKRAQALREDVARIVRHDLKAPLQVVIGVPDLLMDQIKDEDSRKLLSMITESGYRMLNMINLSVDLYKMETGTYPLRAEEMDALPVVRRAAESLAPFAEDAGVSISVFLEGAKPVEGDRFLVRGEGLLISTMLDNLIKNAVEASPKGSEVVVELCRTKGRARLLIRNRGEAPEDIRPVFFDKYATSGKGGGVGLGTYSARLMAQTQNGSVEADFSRAGETRVIVDLPA